MSTADPIIFPPELANVPAEYRVAVFIYFQGLDREKIVRLPELVHIQENHRAVAFAFYSFRESQPQQKSKWHEELIAAVFVAALFVTSIAGVVGGFLVDGQRGGLIGFALGMVSVLSFGAVMLHGHGRRRMRRFFHSDECRAFLEKLK